MPLNCIAVDDEPLALGLVCAFIDKTPFLNLVGRYSSAVEALHGLHSQEVDLVFLDIQMPDLTGIELARLMAQAQQGKHAPRIIFTTAFNQFALDGYKVDALDYLLKPFNYEEFLRATTKAKAYFDLINRPAAATPTPVALPVQEDEYLFLKVEYQLVRVSLSDILYIEGLKDYVKIYTSQQNRPILTRLNLKAMESKLPIELFCRVHLSYIVSLQKITSFQKTKLHIGKQEIPIGNKFSEQFEAQYRQ